MLEPGDVLMVTRLDRLARSTRDLLNVLDEVAKAGAGFKSLSVVLFAIRMHIERRNERPRSNDLVFQ
jgi:DNA invertase Pin-like site-specific DNA recombinase